MKYSFLILIFFKLQLSANNSDLTIMKTYGICYYNSKIKPTEIDTRFLSVLNQTKNINEFINDVLDTRNNKLISNNFPSWVNDDILTTNSKRLLINNLNNSYKISRVFSKCDIGIDSKYKMQLGIIKLINFIKYFYPYSDELNLDSLFLESYNQIEINPSYNNYLLVLKNIGINLEDMHTTIKLDDEYILPENIKIFPFSFSILKDSTLVITSIMKSNLNISVGDTVKFIDNESPINYVIDTYSNDTIRKNSKWLNIRFDSKYNFTIKEIFNQKEKTILFENNTYTLNKDWTNSMYFNVNFEKNVIVSESKNTLYINFNRVKMHEIDIIKNSICKVKTVLVDLRGYPSNRIKTRVKLGNLFYGGEVTRIVTTPPNSINMPRKKEQIEERGEKNDCFNANINIYINHFTQSASETELLNILNNKNLNLIGENTANAIGGVYKSLSLPGGINFQTSYYGIIDKFNRNYYPTGIIPKVIKNDFEINKMINNLIMYDN